MSSSLYKLWKSFELQLPGRSFLVLWSFILNLNILGFSDRIYWILSTAIPPWTHPISSESIGYLGRFPKLFLWPAFLSPVLCFHRFGCLSLLGCWSILHPLRKSPRLQQLVLPGHSHLVYYQLPGICFPGLCFPREGARRGGGVIGILWLCDLSPPIPTPTSLAFSPSAPKELHS